MDSSVCLSAFSRHFQCFQSPSAAGDYSVCVNKRLWQFPFTKILPLTFHLSDAAPTSFPWQQCPLVGLEEWCDHLYALVPGSCVQDSIQRRNTAAGSGRPVHQPAVPGRYTSDPDLVLLADTFIQAGVGPLILYNSSTKAIYYSNVITCKMRFWAVSLGSMSYIANLCTSIFTCALVCFTYVSLMNHRNIWVCIHKVVGNEIKTENQSQQEGGAHQTSGCCTGINTPPKSRSLSVFVK